MSSQKDDTVSSFRCRRVYALCVHALIASFNLHPRRAEKGVNGIKTQGQAARRDVGRGDSGHMPVPTSELGCDDKDGRY